MKLKSLAALALSAVLLLSGCAAPAQNETTPESSFRRFRNDRRLRARHYGFLRHQNGAPR
ncbi:MAG: hypothetical protein V8P99_04825 [Oscillospiraceae bacterium]